jgi:two-component SAPR family response regulator
MTTAAGHVGFNCQTDYWLDVEACEQPASRIVGQSSQVIDTSDAQDLERALQFYKDDLLEGFYENWVLRERERLRIQSR